MPANKRINRWPDFNSKAAASYEFANSRRFVVFNDDPAEVALPELPNNRLRSSRIVYRLLGGKAMFLGMALGSQDKGQGMGEQLIEYFMENVGGLEGEFEGTGLIHKPIISLQLARVGLRAEIDDFRAVLLPLSKYDDTPQIPKVTVLHDEVEDRSRIVEGTADNRFYEEIDPVTAKHRFPAGGNVVNLHTWFLGS